MLVHNVVMGVGLRNGLNEPIVDLIPSSDNLNKALRDWADCLNKEFIRRKNDLRTVAGDANWKTELPHIVKLRVIAYFDASGANTFYERTGTSVEI